MSSVGSPESQTAPLVGIFVGGRSSRMGRPKGLLLAPGSGLTLVERLVEEVASAEPRAECVLVGENSAYAELRLSVIADPISDQGPLGGIVGLLGEAARRELDEVLVLGCDFPYVTANLIRRLMDHAPQADVVCPHLDGRFQPLVARYSVRLLETFDTSLRAGKLALQPLLRAANVSTLTLDSSEAEQLVDWDRPEDVRS